MEELRRVEREKERYNEGLEREGYERFLAHTEYFWRKRRTEILKDEMKYANSRVALELGSVAWSILLEPNDIMPSELHCINISESELERGVEISKSTLINPNFKIMDANNLDFEDKSFDVVFGFGILHHLEYTKALDEILRVLKSDGKMIFFEPLDNNPVGKVVRFLTPSARTEDEKPLRFFELSEFRKRFNHTEYYEGFLSVPLGVLSKLLFKNPDNFITRLAFKIDVWIDRHFSFLRPFFRHIIIVGAPKS